MESRDWIIMGIVVLYITFYLAKNYRKNYYFQAIMLLLGTWFYVNMMTAMQDENIVFPLLMAVMNLLFNLFMINRAAVEGREL